MPEQAPWVFYLPTIHRTMSDGTLRPRLSRCSLPVLSHFQTAADFHFDADALG
jgi:hypothetical protein